MEAQELLNQYLTGSGMWLRAAYRNDATVNKTLSECAEAGVSPSDAYQRVAQRLYAEKNHYKDMALTAAMSRTTLSIPQPMKGEG